MQEYWFILDCERLSAATSSGSNIPLGMDDASVQAIRQYVGWLPLNPELNSVARLYLRQGLAGSLCCIADAPMCCSRVLFLSYRKPLGVRSVPIAARKNASVRRSRRGNGDGSGEPESEGPASDDSDKEDSAELFRRIYLNQQGDTADVAIPAGLLADSLARASNGSLLRQLLSSNAVYVDKHVLLHRLYVGISTQFGTAGTLHKLFAEFLPATRYAIVERKRGGTDNGDESEEGFSEWLSRSMQQSLSAGEAAESAGIPNFHWLKVYRM